MPTPIEITTNYECRKWEDRRADITAVLRPVWKRASSVPLPAPEEPREAENRKHSPASEEK